MEQPSLFTSKIVCDKLSPSINEESIRFVCDMCSYHGEDMVGLMQHRNSVHKESQGSTSTSSISSKDNNIADPNNIKNNSRSSTPIHNLKRKVNRKLSESSTYSEGEPSLNKNRRRSTSAASTSSSKQRGVDELSDSSHGTRKKRRSSPPPEKRRSSGRPSKQKHSDIADFLDFEDEDETNEKPAKTKRSPKEKQNIKGSQKVNQKISKFFTKSTPSSENTIAKAKSDEGPPPNTDQDTKRFTVNADGSYKCNLCSVTFSSWGIMNIHLKIHNNIYKCKICSKQLLTESLYNSHMAVHNSKTCNICNKICSSDYLLQCHIKTHAK